MAALDNLKVKKDFGTPFPNNRYPLKITNVKGVENVETLKNKEVVKLVSKNKLVSPKNFQERL